MKITAFFLLIACMHVQAGGYAQGITLSEKDAPIEKVFREIRKQTGYQFFYSDITLKTAKKITIEVKGATINEVLEKCFHGQPLEYSIEDKTIIVRPKTAPVKPYTMYTETAGSINVRGKVVNENGEPMQASISVKGTNIGTTTNENGEFILNDVDENALLIISGIGIETREVKINGQKNLYVVVGMVIKPLEEAVIKGYYTTTKKLNTGNVTTVKGSDIEKQPISNPILALEGLVPGLYIRQGTGLPGGNINDILLRGKNSLRGPTSTNPLFIVDGVPFPSNSLSLSTNTIGAAGTLSPFNTIGTDDIQSIEILKDADATAIYGSRGANGVILITTKKGKSGKTNLSINAFHGIGTIIKKVSLLNTQQYLELRREAFLNDGITPTSSNARDLLVWDTTSFTDWQDVLIGGTAKQTNIQATLSGGNSNTQFLISGGYRKQTTVLPGNFYDQMGSMHSNITHKSSNDKLHIDLSIIVSNNINKMPIDDPARFMLLAPNTPAIYNNNGELNWQNNTWTNPIALMKRTSEANTNNLVGNLNIKYKVYKGFTFGSSFGYNNLYSSIYNLTPITAFYPNTATTNSRTSTLGTGYIKTYIAEPQVMYESQFTKHNIQFLLGSTFQKTLENYERIQGTGFTSDALLKNLSAASTKNINLSNASEYRLNKFYGRVAYNFDEKYIINLTGSREGSSRFGQNNRFGNFGAIGFAYIFTSEALFEKSISFLSFGKLRASYGTTGNDQIPDFSYLNSYSTSSYSYQNLTTLSPANLSNPYLQWEVVKKLEIGLDLGFAKDRFQISTSYFRNRTGNQLVNYTLPNTTGFTGITANLPATIQNNGLEITLNTRNISVKDFSWESYFNISFIRNKLIAFPNLKSSTYSNTYEIGKSLDVKYTYHYIDMDPETGLFVIEDLNNDGKISSEDGGFYKELKQNYFGGFQNKISFKKVSIDFLFQFVSKYANNIYSKLEMPGAFNIQAITNQPIEVLERWKKPGDQSVFPKASQDYGSTMYESWANAIYSSDKTIQKTDFVRLRNVVITYQFLNNIKSIKAAKIYISGENIFTISNYKGTDPETASFSTVPVIRMITAGIQFTL